MADEVKEFAAWKYDTGSHVKNRLILTTIGLVALSLFAGAMVSPWCLLLLVIPLALAVHIWRADYDHALMVANRYVILGESIVYYRNVRCVRLDKQRETLTITSDRGRNLVIEAARFPTNARKPDKIRHNKSAKFAKVADKIIKRLQQTVPDSVIA